MTRYYYFIGNWEKVYLPEGTKDPVLPGHDGLDGGYPVVFFEREEVKP